MNDTELDRLLDSWKAPAPPPSLREDLRARFPRAERWGFARPMRWGLATVVACVALAFGMAQSSDQSWGSGIRDFMNQVYERLREGIEVRQAASILAQIRQSDPKVYVDGRLVAPLEYGPADSMNVEVPGEGVYSIIVYRLAHLETSGWVQAGIIHGSMIEFQVGGKQVRIECNKPIVNSDHPVFAMLRP
jgi:hypothetical protein